jgi:hypothetical protein
MLAACSQRPGFGDPHSYRPVAASLRADITGMDNITRAIAPVVNRLYVFIAGMVISFIVAFAVAKLANAPDRRTRRAIYSVTGFAGSFVTWYIAFRLIRT